MTTGFPAFLLRDQRVDYPPETRWPLPKTMHRILNYFLIKG